MAFQSFSSLGSFNVGLINNKNKILGPIIIFSDASLNGFTSSNGQPISSTKPYGTLMVTCSSANASISETTNVSLHPIIRVFNFDIYSYWQAIGNTGKYLNSSGTLTTFTRIGDGGSYSNSNITTTGAGSGIYVGARYSGTTHSMITTTYNTSLSCSGEYIDVYLSTGKFILLKSFFMSGNSSFNWVDFPYKMIILGSNDNGASWNLIKNADDLNVNTIVRAGGTTRNSDYLRGVTIHPGYNDMYHSIDDIKLNYNVNASVSYNRIRFVITDLIRGRVLSLNYFNMIFDVIQ
jgi:hypothetical protein